MWLPAKQTMTLHTQISRKWELDRTWVWFILWPQEGGSSSCGILSFRDGFMSASYLLSASHNGSETPDCPWHLLSSCCRLTPCCWLIERTTDKGMNSYFTVSIFGWCWLKNHIFPQMSAKKSSPIFLFSWLPCNSWQGVFTVCRITCHTWKHGDNRSYVSPGRWDR